MEVKIDTKEKFHVITLNDSHLSVNIAADVTQLATKFLHEQISNVVLNLENVQSIDPVASEHVASLQQNFYEHNASFVICGLQHQVIATFDKHELTDTMNITPTESEAWDIVQMEEIERELFEDDDIGFPSHGEDHAK